MNRQVIVEGRHSYDKKVEEFREKELYKFKKYTNNEWYDSLY